MRRPDRAVPAQRVAFGTSGHRGSSFDASFNEAHVLAISQAICRYRQGQGIDGPLFIGIDTHALSVPAWDVRGVTRTSRMEPSGASQPSARRQQLEGAFSGHPVQPS